jgi:molecular chaperone DnaJ
MAKGVSEEICPSCNGSGRVYQQAQTPFGVMQVQTTCRTCGGSGKIYKKNGKILDGDGLERVTEEVEVNIPAGVKD